MTTESKSENQACGGKKRFMLAYGAIQLGTSLVSALSLAVVAISFCSFKQESKLFNECVQEV